MTDVKQGSSENSDQQRVLSFERSTASERLLVAVNLSSRPFSGRVTAAAGSWQDITPDLASRSPTKPSALQLGPWEFRVFSRSAVSK